MDASLTIARPAGGRLQRLRLHLRGIPFFYRVLAGNCLVVVLGAGLGTYLTILFARQEPDASPLWLVGSFMLIGTALSLIVNYLVLRAAFRPLRDLEHTVQEVRHGDLAARAPEVALRDPLLQEFALTLNAMVFRHSRFPNAAKALLAFLMEQEQYEPWLNANLGYWAHTLNAYKDSAVWTSDPKVAIFRDSMNNRFWNGYKGPLSEASGQANAEYVTVQMFASVASGQATPEAAARTKRIAVKGA